MKQAQIDTREITKILVTHLHGDHFGGIPFFILDAQLVAKRTEPMTIAGPPGLRDRVIAAMEILFPGSAAASRKFGLEFVELRPRETTCVGGIDITAFPAVNSSGAPPYSLRVDVAGRVIAYSGDTEWTPALVEAAHGADLFVCEAYFFDKQVKGHLDYSTLLSRLEELSCKRIVLTHMSEEMLARHPEISIAAAADGMRIPL